MGDHLWDCDECGRREFHYHSCNHRNCPQCGRADTADWVRRQLNRRVGAPYFMVTFTLPAELRELFFTPAAKEVHDLFFAAAAAALRSTLAGRWLRAKTPGFSLILHTWNRRLLFHPHLHAIVPGAGLNGQDRVVTVRSADFLVSKRALRRRFAGAFRKRWEQLDRAGPPAIPAAVWRRDWGVHLQAFGDGKNVIKYLGAYVCRTATLGSGNIFIPLCRNLLPDPASATTQVPVSEDALGADSEYGATVGSANSFLWLTR